MTDQKARLLAAIKHATDFLQATANAYGRCLPITAMRAEMVDAVLHDGDLNHDVAMAMEDALRAFTRGTK